MLQCWLHLHFSRVNINSLNKMQVTVCWTHERINVTKLKYQHIKFGEYWYLLPFHSEPSVWEKNMVLWRMFGTERDEIEGIWRIWKNRSCLCVMFIKLTVGWPSQGNMENKFTLSVTFFFRLIPRHWNFMCRCKVQMLGNHPKERIQCSEHDEGLKSRIIHSKSCK